MSWREWEFVDEFETQNEAWSFSLVRILFDGKFYRIGTDSGCSCPTPWENHTDADWGKPLTRQEAINAVRAVSVVPSCMDEKRAAVAMIKNHEAR